MSVCLSVQSTTKCFKNNWSFERRFEYRKTISRSSLRSIHQGDWVKVKVSGASGGPNFRSFFQKIRNYLDRPSLGVGAPFTGCTGLDWENSSFIPTTASLIYLNFKISWILKSILNLPLPSLLLWNSVHKIENRNVCIFVKSNYISCSWVGCKHTKFTVMLNQ